MTQIIIIPRPGHLIDQEVTRAVLKLRDADIQCTQFKSLARIEERGVISIQSDADRERATDIVRSMGLQVQ
jgi:hypothetical protein